MSASAERGAAFFDLDRTLLAGASGTVFSAAMREAGMTSRVIPGEAMLYRLFNAVGETLPSMALARQGARFAKGRARAGFQRAGELAAPQLLALIQPLAAKVFAAHRCAGRPVVMATTSPYDLVRPLADQLGIDDVLATRYGVGADGAYDGTIDGRFVWAGGKLSAVRDWADEHGIDLRASYAYSDSVFDSPLLSAVGHPYAVNPDPSLRVMAAARRWPTLDLTQIPAAVDESADDQPEVHEMATLPDFTPDVQGILRDLTHPLFFPYARFDISGTELLPSTGPAIVVSNHRSYFDSAAMGVATARTNRTIRFLGKKEVFDAPVVGRIAKAMGGIRVDRGTGSDEPLQAAADALAAGDIVAIMPQGTIPRGRAFYDTELRGRWGAARLAKMARVPVIPVGLWGTEKVWPRSSRVPNILNLLDPPTVTVRVGPPVHLVYRSADADTKRIMRAIMDLLPPESRVEREPTAAEIALAMPAGSKGPAASERDRRPGSDD